MDVNLISSILDALLLAVKILTAITVAAILFAVAVMIRIHGMKKDRR